MTATFPCSFLFSVILCLLWRRVRDRLGSTQRSQYVWTRCRASPGRFGGKYHESNRRGPFALVPPAMARCLLDDKVARRKMHRLSVVQFQPELTVQQDRVVHSLSDVHLRSVRLERIGESRQACE